MGRTYEGITPALAEWIAAQPVFFVATAPLAGDGLVNLSPKGLAGTFAVLDERTFAYLDLTGSGVETIAHLQENGRICVMLCAFSGPPRIVRLHGTGRVEAPGTTGRFEGPVGVRSEIVVDVHRVADSCGFGVPEMTLVGDRHQLPEWAERRGHDGVREYQRQHNAWSLDGLPGLS